MEKVQSKLSSRDAKFALPVKELVLYREKVSGVSVDILEFGVLCVLVHQRLNDGRICDGSGYGVCLECPLQDVLE